MKRSKQVTALLNQWQNGDKQALDQLMPLIYQELRGLARAQLSRNHNESIQCTELISEAYMRLIGLNEVDLKDRNHFFSIAARSMRRVLVDRFRKNNAEKRGHNQTLLTFHDEINSKQNQPLDLEQLEHALIKLEKLDTRQADIVTLKFYGGLTADEIAQVLGVSSKTVSRDWQFARLWLHRELNK